VQLRVERVSTASEVERLQAEDAIAVVTRHVLSSFGVVRRPSYSNFSADAFTRAYYTTLSARK
jgi:predicted signal transduction protein with EAL and GGDEF domain